MRVGVESQRVSVQSQVTQLEEGVKAKVKQHEDALEQASKGYAALKDEQQKAQLEANKLSDVMRGMHEDMVPRLTENKHYIEQIRIHGVSAAEVKAKIDAMQMEIDGLRHQVNDPWWYQQGGNDAAAAASAGSGKGTGKQSSNWVKSAMEHKAITNMKSQGSERAGFRMWHEKLVNAFAQVNKGYRNILEAIADEIDSDQHELPGKDIADWMSWLVSNQVKHDGVDIERLNEDMYSVLMDKTEGEAWLKVKSVTSGSGLQAFIRVYRWFACTSGQGLSDCLLYTSPSPRDS